MPIRVRALDLPRDAGRLLDFPATLYADDPHWVAPLRRVERHRLKPSNPFFKHADLVVFGAFDAAELVGTISALRTREASGQRFWFGFFEGIDDEGVVGALVDAVREQVRSWGGTSFIGPRNLTRFEYAGLTVEGFDTLPPMLQGQHKRHYAPRLEAAGLRKHHDTLAYDIDLVQPDGSPTPIPERLTRKAARCDLPGLEVRRARWRSMNRDLERAHEVLNLAYASVPDVTAMPRETFMSLGRLYLVFANTRLMQLATLNGRPVAFTACLPEVNEILSAAQGSLHPAAVARMVLAGRRVRTAAFKLIGVLPEFRGSGLHARMILNVVETARALGYQRIDGSVIDERNAPMRGVVEGAGLQIYRRYRHFEGTV